MCSNTFILEYIAIFMQIDYNRTFLKISKKDLGPTILVRDIIFFTLLTLFYFAIQVRKVSLYFDK